MNLIKYITLLLVTLFFIGCNHKPNISKITSVEDYDTYLNVEENPKLKLAASEKVFWENKFKKAPNQVSYLGPISGVYSQIFEYTGDIKALKKAEKALVLANEKTKNKSVGYLHSLSQNYVKQHRFKEALELLKTAEKLGEKKQITQQLLFDVYLELGQKEQAEFYLNKFKNSENFNYLIRKSKWEDHEGNLDGAISFLKLATEKAEYLTYKDLKLWSYSNLGDYYGHAGEIEKSYQNYLKALKLDPNYNYALKGIAWIVFSHEKNTEEAHRIISSIQARYETPDLYLFKAELEEFLGNNNSQANYLKKYFEMLSTSPEYGDMYNAYNINIWAESNEVSKAIQTSEKEVNNRPTPLSYDLLAWSYLNNNEFKKALAITEKYVVGKTYEPTVLYHIASIYKANGVKGKEVSEIKTELSESLYELGPNMISKIQAL